MIGAFIENYDIISMLNKQIVEQNGSAYFVELSTNGEFGLLNVSKSGETYTEFKSSIDLNRYQNGPDILEQLKKELTTGGDREGTVSTTASDMFLYLIVILVIILIASGYTIYIFKRHNHSRE